MNCVLLGRKNTGCAIKLSNSKRLTVFSSFIYCTVHMADLWFIRNLSVIRPKILDTLSCTQAYENFWMTSETILAESLIRLHRFQVGLCFILKALDRISAVSWYCCYSGYAVNDISAWWNACFGVNATTEMDAVVSVILLKWMLWCKWYYWNGFCGGTAEIEAVNLHCCFGV
jgi:hypothetical protein